VEAFCFSPVIAYLFFVAIVVYVGDASGGPPKNHHKDILTF
jgi:hypothetical protein